MTGTGKPAVWEYGQTILKYIRSTQIYGLTGTETVLVSRYRKRLILTHKRHLKLIFS